jgi:hypothetical protein
MSEDLKNNAGAIPPRFSLKQTEPASEVTIVEEDVVDDAKRKTTRVEIPEVPQEPAVTLKKKTSRIPLEHVTAETGAEPGSPVPGLGVTSKSIRLSPAPPSPPSFSLPPVSTAASSGEAAEATKRQTSRISLDFVLGERQAGGPESTDATATPKTIRIKRPTMTQSIKTLSSLMEAIPVPPPPAPVAGTKSTTSRIELAPETQPEGQATQRKTIKIRRPEAGGGTIKSAPRSLAVARLEGETDDRPAEKANEESVHFLFPIAAAVAFLILGFMIYLLMAQTFPNSNLSYPGKITL